ncbi:MAG: hypothetical protein KGH78_03050 [Candidatus Micrarchaeota archaeon]|nr:hypothetical protein [Candidatus Micrarchaeota archaeon]
MRHAREHVRKFWVVYNRRLIGLLMILIATFYSVGFIFSTLLVQNFTNNALSIMFMWGVLLTMVIVIAIGGVATHHITTVKIMNPKEHSVHSRNIGAFMIILAIGAILFALPVSLMPPEASLMVLFSVGGIMLVLYAGLTAIFGNHYPELGVAAFIFWIMFILAVLFLLPQMAQSPGQFQVLSLIVASVTMVVVFAVIGSVMMYSSSEGFLAEFKKVNRIK